MKLEYALTVFVLLILFSRMMNQQKFKWPLLTAVNLVFIVTVFFSDKILFGLGLILIVCTHYFFLHSRKLHVSSIYLIPLITIAAYKTIPSLAFVGISFLCFRMLSAASEIHAGRVQGFNLTQYLFYCFYLPTFRLGPIGTFQDHLDSLYAQNSLSWNDVNLPQLSRVGYGAVKFAVFTPAVTYYSQSLGYGDWKQVNTVSGLIGTGLFTYAKIYLSFSGFNDIAIGLSHFMNFKMKENFLHPFRAKNVSEFWSNWHVSLTDLLKELLFIPLNIQLLKKFGRDKKLLVTPIVHFVLFITIGLWHGMGWSFVLMGCTHAFAAITAWYFSMAMNKFWSGYKNSQVVGLVSIILTQVFIAVSFIFFECSIPEISQIFREIIQNQL